MYTKGHNIYSVYVADAMERFVLRSLGPVRDCEGLVSTTTTDEGRGHRERVRSKLC